MTPSPDWRAPFTHIVGVARSQVGVREIGLNRGPMVELYQKAVDGRATGEAWCMGFCQWCFRKVDRDLGTKHRLFPSESCITVWERSPLEARREFPSLGYVAIWRLYVNGLPTSRGHCGIIVEVTHADRWMTVEGNTNIGGSREGDGVYIKTRTPNAHATDGLRFVGYLTPWKALDKMRNIQYNI